MASIMGRAANSSRKEMLRRVFCCTSRQKSTVPQPTAETMAVNPKKLSVSSVKSESVKSASVKSASVKSEAVVSDKISDQISQQNSFQKAEKMACPHILVIGGPSGVGKGTVLKLLLDRHPEQFSFSVSNTTRGPRPGEEDGVHYNFVSQNEFEDAIKRDDMLEYAHVHTNYYGTSAQAVEKVIGDGKCCVLDIDVQGAEQVHAHYKNDDKIKMQFVFFQPPSFDELEKRLRGRGTETEEKIQKRLTNAHTETDTAQNKHDFWAFITNEVVEDSYKKLCQKCGVDSKPE